MKLTDLALQFGSALELHQRVRKATHLQFAFADRVDFLNPAQWDSLTKTKGLMMSRDYLRALESSRMSQLETRYAIVFREHEPIVAMSMQILDVSLYRMHAKPTIAKSKPADPVQQLETQLKQRALICGNLLSYQLDGIAFAPCVDAETRWRAVAEVLYRVRRAEKLSGQTNFVLIKDLTAEQKTDSALLHSLSYRTMETEPNMVLTLEPSWKKYEDYLADMTSKYRSSVKKAILEPMLEAGCSISKLTETEVTANADRLQELYLAVQDNADVRPLTVSRGYWPSMARLGPAKTAFLAARQGEKILGFLMLNLDGDTVTAGQIGFDRQAAESLPLYLRLLHAAIELAFETQATRVVFGRTALEPKARMGCKPVETVMWARHRVPVVNALVRGAFGLIQHADAPEIDPFKKAKVTA